MKSRRKAGRGLPPIWFGVLFSFVGIAVAIMMLVGVVECVRPRFWPTAECRILSSSVEKGDKAGDYHFFATYSYSVDGHERKGTAIDKAGETERSFKSIAARKPLLTTFAVGTTHPCHVNPDDPSDAVLRVADVVGDTSWWSGLIVLFPLVFVAVGVLIVRANILARRQNETAVSVLSTKTAQKILPPLFGLVFSGFGYGLLIAYLWGPLFPPELVATTGTVLSSEVEEHRGNKHTYYTPCIAYRYSVNGMEYENDVFSSGGFRIGAETGCRSATAIVRAHPVGSDIVVNYDANDPKTSCLARPSPFGWADVAVCLFLGLFAFVGTLCLVGWVRTYVRLPRLGPRTCQELRLPRKFSDDLGANLVFAFVWNLFCAMFILLLVFVVEDSPFFRIFGGVIIGVFQLIGVWFVWSAVRRIAAHCRGKHYRVKVTANDLRPGETVQLDYVTDGDPVEELKLAVVQSDPLRYRRARSGFQVPSAMRQVIGVKRGFETQSGTVFFVIPKPVADDHRLGWRIELTYSREGTSVCDLFGLKVGI